MWHRSTLQILIHIQLGYYHHISIISQPSIAVQHGSMLRLYIHGATRSPTTPPTTTVIPWFSTRGWWPARHTESRPPPARPPPAYKSYATYHMNIQHGHLCHTDCWPPPAWPPSAFRIKCYLFHNFAMILKYRSLFFACWKSYTICPSWYQIFLPTRLLLT